MTGVRYEVAGAIATLTMDEADNRNALSATLLAGLTAGLTEALTDDGVRAVVLTHEGGTFCAGADLKGGGGTMSDLAELLTSLQDAPKPVVARIAGHCLGGGMGLAAACDLSIAASDVRLSFTEVRLGVAPSVVSVVCLPKMRRADAAELMLTGRRISAAEAAEVGLINRAVPRDELDAATAALLVELTAGGPLALAATKTLLADVPRMDRESAFEHTAVLSSRLFASPEAAEGIAAFRERRPASWVPAP